MEILHIQLFLKYVREKTAIQIQLNKIFKFVTMGY
jgi:hypothetical protein